MNRPFLLDRIKVIFKLKKQLTFYPYPELQSPVLEVVDFKEFNQPSERFGSWRYLFTYRHRGEESPSTFGVGQMTLNGYDFSCAMLDYNPQKCNIPQAVMHFLNAHCAHIKEISDIDVAFDVPGIIPESVLFDSFGSSSVMLYGTLSGHLTRYLHPKSNHGRIKVYDKAKERESHANSSDYEGITRIEVSYHNIGWILFDTWFDQDLDKCNELVRLLDQIKIPSYSGRCPDVSISYNKQFLFVIDSFIEIGRADLCNSYINLLGVNQRAKYRNYVVNRYFDSLVSNPFQFGFDLAAKIQFHVPFKYIQY